MLCCQAFANQSTPPRPRPRSPLANPLTPSPPSHAPQNSDFPNSQLPRCAPDLRHNTAAPFAPHAISAALAAPAPALSSAPHHPLHTPIHNYIAQK
eukprot:scaffold27764_cov55-Phaeocystis_antarctica.AAC.2